MSVDKWTDEALSRWIAEKLFTQDPTRCPWCGWPLKERVEDGCVPGNCSQRPLPLKHEPDMVNDPAMTVMLMREMKKANMQFSIESDPDFNSAVDINAHAEAIKDHRDYGIQLNWGDSNCSHPKPYDPSDGHGYTSFYLICDSLGRAVAEAFALANGYTD